jgi:hypothetical protein
MHNDILVVRLDLDKSEAVAQAQGSNVCRASRCDGLVIGWNCAKAIMRGGDSDANDVCAGSIAR